MTAPSTLRSRVLPVRRARWPRLAGPLSAAALLLAACGGGGDDTAGGREEMAAAAKPGQACGARVNNNFDKLLECVALDGVRAHQAALQAIANSNGGTRAAGTPGYDASVEYVRSKLVEAGYQVSLQPFSFTFFPPPQLRQLTPTSVTFETAIFTGTGFGEVTGQVVPVDINLTPPRANTSGCEAGDFAGFPAGAVALLQRGSCAFGVKALNARAAGAAAVIIFNQGDTAAPDRIDLIANGTLGGPNVVDIPVVAASFADGAALALAAGTVFVKVEPSRVIQQNNVIAELADGDPDNVVMVGAHLDSVQRGPGINDNGSGSAAILEVALQMAKVKPTNKLRFAWWGGEESGLIGSTAYVNGLSAGEKEKIALYLNFDMVGSPNYVFFVYDGDNSDGVGAPAGPEGSEAIEKVFESFYNLRGLPFKGTDFSGRSDYGPFIANGIPAGGLFTGAEGIKTAAEVALWGGTAGAQYDPCYHLACDTFNNNNSVALDANADAVAYATLKYAMSTEDVNGARGKGNFRNRKVLVPFPQPTE